MSKRKVYILGTIRPGVQITSRMGRVGCQDEDDIAEAGHCDTIEWPALLPIT